VVLDDAVVNDRNAVARNMRVCVPCGGDTMRGPARMGYADLALDGRGLERVLQRLDLADGAYPRQLAGGGQNREAG